MRLFLHQLKGEQLIFWRSREAAVFVFLFSILLFLLLGAVYNGTINGHPAPDVLLGVRPIAGLEGAIIVRALSGLPFSRSDSTGALAGLPNGSRLPASATLDVLVRRPLRLGRTGGGIYLDVRNLLNRRNVVAVRRDTGQPQPDVATVNRLAQAAYQAHPETIPYESSRYRRSADLNGDGYISGAEELLPLYVAAARDFTQPIFAYGAPRLVRLGVELLF